MSILCHCPPPIVQTDGFVPRCCACNRVVSREYRDLRDALTAAESRIAVEASRADVAVRHLDSCEDVVRLVKRERDAAIARAEKAEAAMDEVEEELGCIKEAITQHLPCYVSENDEDDECDAVDTIEEAGRELARLKATVGSHVSAGTYAKRVDERDEARAALALAERARDEVGIQYAAAQAEIARLRRVVDEARHIHHGDVGHRQALADALLALDTVPGDALAPSNVKGVG